MSPDGGRQERLRPPQQQSQRTRAYKEAAAQHITSRAMLCCLTSSSWRKGCISATPICAQQAKRDRGTAEGDRVRAVSIDSSSSSGASHHSSCGSTALTGKGGRKLYSAPSTACRSA